MASTTAAASIIPTAATASSSNATTRSPTTTSTTTDSLPRIFPALPDEIAVLCLARVPRLYHPTLSLVSRSWRALFSSPTLFSVRAGLSLSDHFPCIAVRTPSKQIKWYLLDRLSHRPLLSLPPSPLPSLGSAAASFGPLIFVLGGSVDDLPTRDVQIFDLRFNKWSVGPRMGVARQFAAAGVVAGKLYVLGGCLPSSDSWAEVFDPEDGEGKWSSVPSPSNVRERWMHGSAVLDGRILAMADRGGMDFDPMQETWGPVSTVLDLGWKGRAAVVGGIVYSYDFLGNIKGYDQKVDNWTKVEGVAKKLPKFLSGATLANVGGRLCVFWEGKRSLNHSKQMKMMFAEIELKAESTEKLSGTVMWSEAFVLPVPDRSTIAHCLAVQL